MPRKKKEAADSVGHGTSSFVNAFLAMKRKKTYEPAQRPVKEPKPAKHKPGKAVELREPAPKSEQKAVQGTLHMNETEVKQEPAQGPLLPSHVPASSHLALGPVSTVTTETASPTGRPDAAALRSSIDSLPGPATGSTARGTPASGHVESLDGGDKGSSVARAEAAGEAEGEKAEAAVQSGRVTRSRAKQAATVPAKRPKVEKSELLRAGDTTTPPGRDAQAQVPRGCKRGRALNRDPVLDRDGTQEGVSARAEEPGESEHRGASTPGRARAKDDPMSHEPAFKGELAPHEPAVKEGTSEQPSISEQPDLQPGTAGEVPGRAEGDKTSEESLAAARQARAREALSQYPPIQINRAPVLVLWVAVVAEREGFAFEEGLSLGQAVAAMFAQSKGRRLGLYAEKEKEDAEEKEARRKAEGTTQVEVFGLHLQAKLTGDGLLEAHMGGHPVCSSAALAYVKRAFGEHLDPAADAMRLLTLQFPSNEVGKRAYHLYEAFRPMVASGVRGWGAKGPLHLSTVLQAGRFIP